MLKIAPLRKKRYPARGARNKQFPINRLRLRPRWARNTLPPPSRHTGVPEGALVHGARTAGALLTFGTTPGRMVDVSSGYANSCRVMRWRL